MSNMIYKGQRTIPTRELAENEPSYDKLRDEFESVLDFLNENDLMVEWTMWRMEESSVSDVEPEFPILTVNQLENLTEDVHMTVREHVESAPKPGDDSLEDKIRNVLMENFEPVEND